MLVTFVQVLPLIHGVVDLSVAADRPDDAAFDPGYGEVADRGCRAAARARLPVLAPPVVPCAPGGVGFGCGGCGGGGGSGGAVPQATWGLPLGVVRSGLAAVKEWAPSRETRRHW